MLIKTIKFLVSIPVAILLYLAVGCIWLVKVCKGVVLAPVAILGMVVALACFGVVFGIASLVSVFSGSNNL
jgi:hypothetical protein